MTVCVAFDLDMTLIDPRPGFAALVAHLAQETSQELDVEKFVSELGPPLVDMFVDCGAAPSTIDYLVREFRDQYPDYVIPHTTALPGVTEALDAVKQIGGQVLVVTGKYEPNALRHVKAFNWPVDVLVGNVFGAGKAVALREYDAFAMVGDHPGDMLGAQQAGILPLGVATGAYTATQLLEAGAEEVLADLTEFSLWLTQNV
jgi:phosphoglycolate phosphatase